MGWIAVHSIYAWKDLASSETLEIAKGIDALLIQYVAASNYKTAVDDDKTIYYRDGDDWYISSFYEAYNSSKHAKYGIGCLNV